MISRKLHSFFPRLSCLLQFLQGIVLRVRDWDWGWGREGRWCFVRLWYSSAPEIAFQKKCMEPTWFWNSCEANLGLSISWLTDISHIPVRCLKEIRIPSQGLPIHDRVCAYYKWQLNSPPCSITVRMLNASIAASCNILINIPLGRLTCRIHL